MVKTKEGTCQLTMKPTLMKSQSILTAYDSIENNKQYLGIVKQISTSGLLVEFFGSVFGWVPKKQLSFERVEYLEIKFKIGQIVRFILKCYNIHFIINVFFDLKVNCTVIKYLQKSKRLTLSLKPPKIVMSGKLLKLGQHVDAVVTNIIDQGIEVKINGLNIPAFVPLLHITKFSSLANVLAGKCNLICYI